MNRVEVKAEGEQAMPWEAQRHSGMDGENESQGANRSADGWAPVWEEWSRWSKTAVGDMGIPPQML